MEKATGSSPVAPTIKLQMIKNTERPMLLIVMFITALLCPGKVSAETVYLKNGKVISGKIVERTDKYIRIESDGVRDIRFTDEIERIEETGAPVAAKAQQEAVVAVAEDESYIDKRFKFEIRGPRGWFKKPGITYTMSTGATYTTAPTYSKHAHGKGEMALPAIDMLVLGLNRATDESLKGFNNAIDVSRFNVQQWEEMGAKIIEAPHEIEVNGIKGARCVVEKADPDGKLKRVIEYTFMSNDVVITINGVGWLDTFDADIKDFEAAANSFKFIN